MVAATVEVVMCKMADRFGVTVSQFRCRNTWKSYLIVRLIT